MNQGKEVSTTTIQTTSTSSITTTIPCLGNCTGSAGLCKEYKCLEGTCVIITLSDCCGNDVCEDDEHYGLYTNCSKDCPTVVSEIEHQSCAESGKIKVLVLGLAGIEPTFTQDLLDVLNQAIVGYPVDLTIERFETLEIATNDPLSKEYSTIGFPTTIINCHLKFTGQRTVDNFKSLFDALLETENK